MLTNGCNKSAWIVSRYCVGQPSAGRSPLTRMLSDQTHCIRIEPAQGSCIACLVDVVRAHLGVQIKPMLNVISERLPHRLNSFGW